MTVIGAVAVGMGVLAGGVAGQASGPTQAPDLQSVDNFTNGTAGDENYTFADFTFDQPVEGADSAGNFELVPIDGSGVVDGQNIVDGNATRTITVAFPTSVSQGDIARGIVQPSTVRVAGEGDETTNPLQTADVSNDGNSVDPDLVNVTVNETTNSLVYAFDEPVSANSDGGFQVYAENTTQYDGNVATDSLATPRLVNVSFDSIDVSAAVGASVTQGTVSNQTDSDRTNSPDEVVVSNESAPEFSRCGDGGTTDMGDGGNADGPTQAPDLVGIDNFTYREKPGAESCQTLVEFDFDEPVDTQGGPGNFQLVTLDSTIEDGNGEIVGSREDTTSLTVPFPGRIDPDTIARGFVDANTVQRLGEGDVTLNPKQAAAINDDGTTATPDIVSITESDAPGNALLFEFDEEISEVGDTSGFNFYDANGTETDAQEVATTDDPRVLSVAFEPTDPVSTAVGGSADANAATGTDTAREDGDKNKPDEALVTAGNDTCESEPLGPAGEGPTRAPDLESVSGFCTGNIASHSGQETFVNFTFDEPIDVVGDAGNVQLVRTDGGEIFDGVKIVAGNDTRQLTVAFDDDANESIVARGFVDANTVKRVGASDATNNPLQAAAVSNDGNSTRPDLVSVTVNESEENALDFRFDEPIGERGDTSGFNYYDENGTEVASNRLALTEDPQVVIVRFEPAENPVSDAVGGSIESNAVSGEDGETNQPDEVAVENGTATGPGPVGDFENPSTDTDGDGQYEDVNGDGQLTQADAQALYDSLDSSTVQNNVDAFDFNGDGSVTQADAQALYDEWSTAN
ncbi:dockerin type I domain-containing protein [Halococcus saccharolyticus]|uniref:dockerin type I domain-containing protein n=1 Tax=Halococcus saccharolyticus TaxID=62319 RepID=UPI000AE8F229|nr:dockerin type I domain-containing protein [Halococcus saccharolyticus]